MIEIYVPEKDMIEQMLRDMADKIKHVDEICEIETLLVDSLSELDCHVENRANIERREKP